MLIKSFLRQNDKNDKKWTNFAIIPFEILSLIGLKSLYLLNYFFVTILNIFMHIMTIQNNDSINVKTENIVALKKNVVCK